MGFTIDNAAATAVVPWGRNLEAYQQMFSLTAIDLDKKILGCGDGPASFNAEMHQQGRQVISLDPIYQFTAAQIKERIVAIAGKIKEQLLENQQDYSWRTYHDPETLVGIRLAAMDLFLADFEKGKQAGRYLIGALPELPFADQSFDLALCSHLLFSYSHQLDIDFHERAIREMCRVSREVRIFPLLEIDGKRSRHLENLMERFKKVPSVEVAMVTVEYEFQKGGCQMLVCRVVDSHLDCSFTHKINKI